MTAGLRKEGLCKRTDLIFWYTFLLFKSGKGVKAERQMTSDLTVLCFHKDPNGCIIAQESVTLSSRVTSKAHFARREGGGGEGCDN